MSVAEVIEPTPRRLPAKAAAQLPASYAEAKLALERCERVDECQAWADRAAALASYARQARDHELEAMAKRIRARAVRRAGELLQQIPTARGRRRDLFPERPTGARTDAARAAGLSVSQHKIAVRLAEIPSADFEAAVGAPEPPGTTRLAYPAKPHSRPQRPAPADDDGDVARAYRLLDELIALYRAAPPLLRQRIRDAVLRAFSAADVGDDRIRPPRN